MPLLNVHLPVSALRSLSNVAQSAEQSSKEYMILQFYALGGT
jgi:hypothetical protein